MIKTIKEPCSMNCLQKLQESMQSRQLLHGRPRVEDTGVEGANPVPSEHTRDHNGTGEQRQKGVHTGSPGSKEPLLKRNKQV